MRLPNGDRAVVDIEKLRDYCLNLDHPRGRHKARRFLSVLGIAREHATELRRVLLRVAAESDSAEAGESDRFGRRYVLDFDHRGPAGVARIRGTWIVRTGEETPRLTTCYVLGEA